MIGDYFAARPDEIDEELVELGPEDASKPSLRSPTPQ